MDLKSSRTFIKAEVELRGRPESEISHWWRTLTLLSYLTVSCSGIALSISTGDILAAFENKCILYSKLSLLNLDSVPSNKSLAWSNLVQDKWSEIYDCSLCEYSGASSVLFGGVLFVLFLQSGKGGLTGKSQRNSWEIVPFALIVNLIFFIISTVVMTKTLGGLTAFCTYTLTHTYPVIPNLSCGDLFDFHYPMDQYHTGLYLAYIVSQIAAIVMFLGWFTVLVVILLRFLLGVDFVIYRREQYAIVENVDLDGQLIQPSIKDEFKKPTLYRKRNAKTWNPKPFYEELHSSSDSDDTEDGSFETETSFFLPPMNSPHLKRP